MPWLLVATEMSWRTAVAHTGAGAWKARVGYCALTVSKGDCHLGDSGTLEEDDAAASLRRCRLACEKGCPRCAVVSWSAKNRDCSWYAHCDLDDLRRPPKEAPDYVSSRVRTVPLPVPLAPRWPHLKTQRPMAVAITTTLAPGASSSCALVQWCERASLFARALRGLGWTSSVVVLAESGQSLSAAECPEASLSMLDARLAHLIRRCEARTSQSGDSHARRMKVIFKLGAQRRQTRRAACAAAAACAATATLRPTLTDRCLRLPQARCGSPLLTS